VRIAAVSDIHGHLPAVPPCDLLLLGGDLCPVSDHDPDFQARWLDTEFRAWLEAVPARHIIGVAGNHDFIFERAPDQVPAGLRWVYLEDTGAEVEGLRVWGSPWQPPFFDWAFNLDDAERAAKWALIPDGTEVLVLHGPPYGYGDHTLPYRGRPGQRVGCRHLAARLEQLPRLRLAVFGHIHPGQGLSAAAWNPAVALANVSLVNERYEPVHPVMLFQHDDGVIRAVSEGAG
jgi:3',5'-cyclic AMP phosphodiesterase CpdA